MGFELDYDEVVILDAEDLAEGGIKRAYTKLQPKLRQFVPTPEEIVERLDPGAPSYSISFRGQEYPIFAPGDEEESWGRFHAINGGNDLGGMFLTEEQVAAARLSYETKSDWPYIPTLRGPWYGQEHD